MVNSMGREGSVYCVEVAEHHEMLANSSYPAVKCGHFTLCSVIQLETKGGKYT